MLKLNFEVLTRILTFELELKTFEIFSLVALHLSHENSSDFLRADKGFDFVFYEKMA